MSLPPFNLLLSDRFRSFAGTGLLALVLAALAGCTTYVSEEPAPPVVYEAPENVPIQPAAVAAAPSVVMITADSDFYTPLGSYGTWIDVDGYGRCWRPRNVGDGWHPYAEGHWVSTDAGWCWQSSEPFGWATYHYGRWNNDPSRGWYWVPQTVWAPAWVSWRQGAGYCGWAPLPPRARPGIEVTISPQAYVFVDEHHFTEPLRSTTVIVNNTTVINKTVIITNTHVTNNITINSGPRRADIEKITGRSIKPVAVAQVRATEDARSGLRAQSPVRRAPTAANSSRVAQPIRPAQPSGAAQAQNRPTPLPATLNDKAKADQQAQAATMAKAETQAPSRTVTPPVDTRTARPVVDPKAAAEAKAKADAKVKADAKKKADAEKARLEQEKRDEETKPQQ